MRKTLFNQFQAVGIYVIFFVIAFSFPAFAEEPVNCYARYVNTLEVGGCFEKQLKKYDTELNSTYQAVMEKLKVRGTWGSLKKAQREWIKYRDQNCMFHSDLYFGGSAAGPAYVECKARMTKERSDELNIVLEDLNRH
ncbi:MAG TPA: lysozyme inhibitor LprI family protein [Mariprofundaceae bacterium]|nr:lysozyme inhibitor LprI family protein [Mariprofundaceae bacterium]